MSPSMLQHSINDLKDGLINKNAPFGVDLALPQVGGNARKTNVCHIVAFFPLFTTEYPFL